MKRSDVRNVAIIAHVDHGKTTLVDGLLKQAGSFRKGEVVAERALDSGDLERERGITILAKCTSVTWNGTRINLVDTPGHADFGGEVERVLGMVDAVLLLVDAGEGPMPQTRFVTTKAFELGLPALVCVNKIDRPEVDPDGVVDAVFDLFGALGASDQQLDFPVVYASARDGYAIREVGDEPADLAPLLDLLVEKVPPAEAEVDGPMCMQAATLAYDDYLGYMAIGRVKSGRCAVGDRLLLAGADKRVEFRVQKVLGFQGLKRFELSEAVAGDIVAITGMSELNVGETITAIDDPIILPPLAVDAPTLSMDFRANDGPFAGIDGRYVTSRNLRERLAREVRSNISLEVAESDQEAGTFKVSGRGELHLSILIETMRREGFELCVSQPRVIYREGPAGERLEPFEDVVIDLDEEFSGPVIEELGRRLGKMTEMRPSGGGRQRLEYRMPARGLIGYRSQFLTDTRGSGVMYSRFAEYGPFAGPLRSRRTGVLIAQDQGTSNAYALFSLQDRGRLFIGRGSPFMEG